jgi:hypothetical protein
LRFIDEAGRKSALSLFGRGVHSGPDSHIQADFIEIGCRWKSNCLFREDPLGGPCRGASIHEVIRAVLLRRSEPDGQKSCVISIPQQQLATFLQSALINTFRIFSARPLLWQSHGKPTVHGPKAHLWVAFEDRAPEALRDGVYLADLSQDIERLLTYLFRWNRVEQLDFACLRESCGLEGGSARRRKYARLTGAPQNLAALSIRGPTATPRDAEQPNGNINGDELRRFDCREDLLKGFDNPCSVSEPVKGSKDDEPARATAICACHPHLLGSPIRTNLAGVVRCG